MATDDDKDKPALWRQYGALTAIPFLLAAGPLLGFYMGSWVDNRFGTKPWAQGVLILLGFVAAVREVVRIIRQSE